MNTGKWKTYTFWILLSEAAGALSGWLTREETRRFSEAAVQPPLSPPAWVFPVVWVVLYLLMGVGAARIRMTAGSHRRSGGLNLFVLQLTVNFFWSLIFFNAGAYGFALLWLLLLWVLVLLMILSFRKTDPAAAWMQLPYQLWLTFALYLNAGVWYLNK